jgi:hypothetical protein
MDVSFQSPQLLVNAVIGEVDSHLMSHLLSSPTGGYLGNNRKQ